MLGPLTEAAVRALSVGLEQLLEPPVACWSTPRCDLAYRGHERLAESVTLEIEQNVTRDLSTSSSGPTSRLASGRCRVASRWGRTSVISGHVLSQGQNDGWLRTRSQCLQPAYPGFAIC